MITDILKNCKNYRMEMIQQVLKISLLPIATSRPANRRRFVGRPRMRRGANIRRDFVAVECKRTEEVRTGREHLEENY
jgi:hypothetical protein